VSVCLQAPFEHELRLGLDGGKGADYVFVKAGRQAVGFDVRDKAVLVAAIDERLDIRWFTGHASVLLAA
jgi:hypothetical protein